MRGDEPNPAGLATAWTLVRRDEPNPAGLATAWTLVRRDEPICHPMHCDTEARRFLRFERRTCGAILGWACTS